MYACEGNGENNSVNITSTSSVKSWKVIWQKVFALWFIPLDQLHCVFYDTNSFQKKFFIMVMIIKKLACEKEQASCSIWVPYYFHLIIIIPLLSWYPLSSYHIMLFVGSIGRRQVLLNFVELVTVLDMCVSSFTCGLGGYYQS